MITRLLLKKHTSHLLVLASIHQVQRNETSPFFFIRSFVVRNVHLGKARPGIRRKIENICGSELAGDH
jgi:hypothetical protein